jgi:hypothetical protein
MYKETTGVDFYEELDKNLKKIGEWYGNENKEH